MTDTTNGRDRVCELLQRYGVLPVGTFPGPDPAFECAKAVAADLDSLDAARAELAIHAVERARHDSIYVPRAALEQTKTDWSAARARVAELERTAELDSTTIRKLREHAAGLERELLAARAEIKERDQLLGEAHEEQMSALAERNEARGDEEQAIRVLDELRKAVGLDSEWDARSLLATVVSLRSQLAAREALDGDVREVVGWVADQHECDHPRHSCGGINCFGQKIRRILAALEPTKQQAEAWVAATAHAARRILAALDNPPERKGGKGYYDADEDLPESKGEARGCSRCGDPSVELVCSECLSDPDAPWNEFGVAPSPPVEELPEGWRFRLFLSSAQRWCIQCKAPPGAVSFTLDAEKPDVHMLATLPLAVLPEFFALATAEKAGGK